MATHPITFPVTFPVTFSVTDALQEFSGAYPLSFASLGITADGYVYDGLASRFWADNGMTTLASASGTDTIAVIEDLSGNANHAVQTTTANRPVYYTDGTIASLKSGSISGVRRFMRSTDTVTSLDTFTIYSVFKRPTPDGSIDGWAFIFLKADASNYFGIRTAWDNPTLVDSVTPAGFGPTYGAVGPTANSVPGVVRMIKTSGSNAISLVADDVISFASLNIPSSNNTLASTAMDSTAQLFSYDTGTTAILEHVFTFCAFADIGETARTAIETYITDNLASWAGN